MDLTLVRPPTAASRYGENVRLATLIATALSTNEPFIDRLEIQCDGAIAIAVMAADADVLLFTDNEETAKLAASDANIYAATGSHYCGHRLVITGNLLAQIRLEMSDTKSRAGYARAVAKEGA